MDDLAFFVISGICYGAIFALIALGYTLVYGIIKLINFAHGEFFMVGAYAGFGAYSLVLILAPAAPVTVLIPAIIFIAGLAGAGIAVATERVAYKPIRGSGRLAALLTAIGVSFLLQSLFTYVNNATPLLYPANQRGDIGRLCQESILIGGGGVYVIRFAFILVCVLLTGWLWHRVFHTRFGKAMRAVSQDPDAAALMGIPVDRVIRRTFMVGGAMAGVAGALVSLETTVNPMMGFIPGLKAFIAAVIGGIGSIPGAVLGGFLIGIIEQLAIWAGVPSGYKDVAAFVILVIVLVFRPQGILGKREREKV